MRSWHKCIHVLTTLRLRIKGIENSYLLRIYFVAGTGSNPSFHYVPGTRGGLKDFRGVHEIKTFLAIMLRSCWPVFTLFSQEYAVWFPRGYMKCDIATDWMQKQTWESNCLLWSCTLKRFTNMQNSATPLCVSFVKVVL